MPKISVIVPVYNVEKYLNRCVDSILAQTFEDFELILVDDGALDSSGDICDEYAQKDYRVKVIHKENSGVSSARNAGIDIATGQYIMFVDSDDYIDETMLEDMVNATQSDVDMVITSIEMVSNNKTQKFQMKDCQYNSHILMEEYALDEFPNICLNGPCCKFYKKSIVSGNYIRFKENLSLGEDTFFNMDYLMHCHKITTLSKCYYKYMRNEGSLFSRFQKDTYFQGKRVFERVCGVLQELQCSEKSIEAYKRKHITIMLANIFKACTVSDKNVTIDYIKNVALDNDFLMRRNLLNSGFFTKMVLWCLEKGKYGSVRMLYRMRVKLSKIKNWILQ